MKNFFDKKSHEEIMTRLLTVSSCSESGKMDVSRMLEPYCATFEVAQDDRSRKNGLPGYLFGGQDKKKYVCVNALHRNDPADAENHFNQYFKQFNA